MVDHMPNETSKPRTPSPRLRRPTPADGAAIWELVRQCDPLDENSMYCNLVQADHFRDTCVVAELNGELIGWVSGHMIPDQNALFVWQVAVAPTARGMGLGRSMLTHLIERDAAKSANTLKTTITRDNDASWALFRRFAHSIGGALEDRAHYTRDAHFNGRHDTEHMVTITLPQRPTLVRAA